MVAWEGWCSSKPVPQMRARVVRGHAYYPKHVRAYRDDLAYTFRSFRNERCPFRCLVRVEIDVAGLNKLADLDNLTKGVLDSLVTAGVLVSDRSGIVAEQQTRVVEPGVGVWVRVIPLASVACREP